MTYNPAFSDPSDPNSGDLADVALIVQMLDNILHNQKYKVQTGEDTAAGGLAVARGRKAVSFSGDTDQTATITFASDAEDGDPAFASAPTVIGIALEYNFIPGTPIYFSNTVVAQPTTTGFQVDIAASGGSITGTLYLHWAVIGQRSS